MPFYISKVSIEQRYGDEALNFDADDDADGALDEEKVREAIRDAESEVNSYLIAAYTLPFPGVTDVEDPENNASVPAELRRPCVDIAMYRLVPEHDRLTKERRRRYDDAIKWLTLIAEGKVQVTLPDAPSSGRARITAEERLMTRSKLDGLV